VVAVALGAGPACERGDLQPDNVGGGRGGTGAGSAPGMGGTAGTGSGGAGAAPATVDGGIATPSGCSVIATGVRQFNPCGRTTSLAYSPDGRFLVAGLQQQQPNVRVWRLSDGALVRDIDGIGTVTYDVEVSPDGRTIAAAGSPGGGSEAFTPDIVKLWDFDTGALLRTLPATSGFYADTVGFSPDGTLLATAGYVGPIEVWRVSDGALVTRIPYPTSVHNVHFGPTGTQLIVGGVDGRATIWAVPSGTQLMILSGIADEMADAAFSPDGAEIASTGPGNSIVLWDAKTGSIIQMLAGHELYVSHVLWAGPDRILSNDWGGTIRLWTRTDGAFHESAGFLTDGQSLGIAVAPDQQTFVAGGVNQSGVEGFVFWSL